MAWIIFGDFTTLQDAQARIEASLKSLHTKVDKLKPATLPAANLAPLWTDIDRLRKLAASIPTTKG